MTGNQGIDAIIIFGGLAAVLALVVGLWARFNGGGGSNG